MKQIQIAYQEEANFLKELQDFKRKCETDGISKMMFQIYSEILESDTINALCDTIEQVFPEVPYFGCSTSGNIVDCQVSTEVSVVATIFEYESTQFEIFQYDRSAHPIEWITAKITEDTKKNPWVKAIEMYLTIPEGSYTKFCNGLDSIRPDIQMFGGVACSNDITSDASCVFSKVGGFSETSIIVIFYGGDDFHVDSKRISGWKPLGRKFTVTKSDGSTLHELDGIRAYDVYHKYLNIPNDENFFYNTLEFPLFYEHNCTTIVRVPVASNADGSISMSSDIDVGSTVSLSYGDPKTIVQSIAEDSDEIREFCPDVLHIFSCAARKTFWDTNEPTYEIEPFRDISSSVGFFSHGEFIRTNSYLNQHNVTLVVSAMREGKKQSTVVPTASNSREHSTKIPLVSRLAMFITATSLELEEANKSLETANTNLQKAAITDGMTSLFNRTETHRRIAEQLANLKDTNFSLVMFDIDNFKQVNDNFGHQEGDTVIIALADILHNEIMRKSTKYSAGRWGGEEFMLVLPDTDASAASLVAELIRQCFSNTTFPAARTQTVSLGVTQFKEGDTIDSLCTRVDTALYQAKKTGKNKVVVL